MSIIYPMEAPLVKVFFENMTQDDAKKLFEKAKIYSFVKSLPDGQIKLHDEMQPYLPTVELQDQISGKHLHLHFQLLLR